MNAGNTVGDSWSSLRRLAGADGGAILLPRCSSTVIGLHCLLPASAHSLPRGLSPFPITDISKGN